MTEPEIAGYLTYYHESALSQTKKVPFYMGENTIGRDPNNKVTILDSTISKVHAKLVVTPTEMHYIDIGKNGTKVNSNLDESRIVPNQPVSIFTGVTLYLGDMVCKV
jgi:pSer/pThr/pTyr-binding forkhead associated (FHA) protein